MRLITAIVFALLLNGCAVLNLGEGLNRSLLNQQDPELIRASMPTFIILNDALIDGDQNDEDFLISGAKLYGAYSGAFLLDSPERAKLLNKKAFGYAKRALCEELEDLCAVVNSPFDEYVAELAKVDDQDDLLVLYTFASSWAGLIQANSSDWSLIAALPKVKATIQHVLKLDNAYDQGTAHIYAGVMESLLPPSLGGKPETARAHFEQAIVLSQSKNLFAKVMYAKQYARLLFEQELHDRLLKEVVSADPVADGLTLMNVIAQEQAQALLDSSSEYFE